MADNDDDIPVLTDAIERVPPSQGMADDELAELEATICSASLRRAEALLRDASREAEHVLVESVMRALRAELPDLVRRAVRSHFDR